jgi:hypothetical protein
VQRSTSLHAGLASVPYSHSNPTTGHDVPPLGGLAGHGEPPPASRPPELLPPLLELLPPELLAPPELPELLAVPELPLAVPELLLAVPELPLAVPELLVPELLAPELAELPIPELLPVLPLVPELPETDPSPPAPPPSDPGIVKMLPPHAHIAASPTTIKSLDCIAASVKSKSDASSISKVYEQRRRQSNVGATSRLPGDAPPHARASWATSLERRLPRSRRWLAGRRTETRECRLRVGAIG